MGSKKGKKNELSEQREGCLFRRVAAILDQAQNNVVCSVNTNTELAYRLSKTNSFRFAFAVIWPTP